MNNIEKCERIGALIYPMSSASVNESIYDGGFDDTIEYLDMEMRKGRAERAEVERQEREKRIEVYTKQAAQRQPLRWTS